ncbi:MAG: CRTAC1 family protein [Planctomycetota bacterium]|nr:CRTAC1 family protein [Planctomycetota bacterium]MDA1212957.1 CRTAC1 family protein [Planctomycetota bacterium]
MTCHHSNCRFLVFTIAVLSLTAKLIAAEPPMVAEFRDETGDFGLALGNGAACWADLDNDGWSDLCAGGTAWRNDAGQRFTNLADGLGEVVAADFNNDGFVDLFSWSTMRVLRNIDGTGFEALELPELPACVSRGACWGDFNTDGFCDLYVAGYEDWNNGITYPDLILMNHNGNAFKLTWSEVRFRARGVSACDFDEDGDIDIYVSNYRLQPNVLWINDGTGTFTDETVKYNALATSPGFQGGHSIGAAWGDFDNDGRFDLFAGNFAHVDGRGDQPKSRFLRNTGDAENPAFENRGPGGVFYQESYASPSAGDFDNDGDLDLFFTTVYETASFGRKNNPVLFRNDGQFEFTDVTAAVGLADLGATYQNAWSDFDQDGDLDLVTQGKLFVNHSPSEHGHWLGVRLEGDGKHVSRSAIGAQIRIQIGNRTITRQVEAGTGEGNQNDLTLHCGLGLQPGQVDLKIRWPNGKKQSLTDVKLDGVITARFEP